LPWQRDAKGKLVAEVPRQHSAGAKPILGKTHLRVVTWHPGLGGRSSPAQPPRALYPYVTYVEVEVRQKFRHGTPFQTTVYDELTALPYSVCDVIRVTANPRFITYSSEKTLTIITYGSLEGCPMPKFLTYLEVDVRHIRVYCPGGLGWTWPPVGMVVPRHHPKMGFPQDGFYTAH